MSTLFSFYMGPYAELCVPEKTYDRINDQIFEMTEEFSEKHSILHIACTEDWDQPKGLFRDCWIVYWSESAKGQPEQPRKFSWTEDDNDLGMWELEGISAKREIKWFERTVRDELRQLAELYETDPVLKWGVVVEKS